MKKVIFLSAGHSLTDPGSVSIYGKESDFNIEIRNALIPELERNDFEIKIVPDDLDLKGSIAWVNANSSKIEDGLALEIHANCCGSRGVETYYYGQNAKSKDIATKLIEGYCQETGLPRSNGGVRSDTTGRFGELGWIRLTKPYATLIECFYIDSKEDVKYAENNIQKMAAGICRGVCNVYGIPYIPETENTNPEKTKEEIKAEIINLIKLL